MGELLLIFFLFIAFNAVVFGAFVFWLKRLRNGGPLFAVEDEELLALLRIAAKTEGAVSPYAQPGKLKTASNGLIFYSELVRLSQTKQSSFDVAVSSGDQV